MKVRELIQRFESFAPKYLAVQGDPVGLQVGDLNAEVTKVLVTLDVRPEVVDEAIRVGADLIFAHHPVMFRPARNLDLSDPQNAMYAKLLQHQITVYAAHTNLDNADGGMNDWLANQLQLSETTGLIPQHQDAEYLVTVHVLPVYVEAVRLAMTEGGARTPEPHRGISYEWNATTWLTPSSGTDTILGPVGERPQSDEVTVEARVSQTRVADTLQAVKDVLGAKHPAVQLTLLKDAGHTYYMGRVGVLPKTMSVGEFATHCKTVFGVSGLRLIAADLHAPVKKVAVLGGDGGKFFEKAIGAGADAYVTGDVYYHTGHDMLANRLPVVDPGHHIESICKPELVALFNKWRVENEWPLTVVASQLQTDPFTFI